MDRSIIWRFDKVQDKTKLSLEIEYEIPASLLHKVKENIIIQENEHDVDTMIENLKSYVELEMAYG